MTAAISCFERAEQRQAWALLRLHMLQKIVNLRTIPQFSFVAPAIAFAFASSCASPSAYKGGEFSPPAVRGLRASSSPLSHTDDVKTPELEDKHTNMTVESQVVRMPAVQIRETKGEDLRLHVMAGTFVVRVVAVPIRFQRTEESPPFTPIPFKGLQRNDEILSIDGRAVTTFRRGESFKIYQAQKLEVRRYTGNERYEDLVLMRSDR